MSTAHILPEIFLRDKIRVALVGAGGTGSQMLTGLARLHIALKSLGHPEGLHVGVFDPDRVSPSNIGRQLFAPSDVGQYKATVLVNRLNCWFGLNWEAIPARLDRQWIEGSHGSWPHILITCVDTAQARREICSAMRGRMYNAPRYWLDCGNQAQIGQVFLTELRAVLERDSALKYEAELCKQGKTPQEAKRWQPRPDAILPPLWDVLPEIFDASIPEDNRPSCSLAEALEEQGLYINQHVATWALTLLEKLFRDGKLTTHGYWINLEDGRVTPVPVPSPELPKPTRRGRKACVNG